MKSKGRYQLFVLAVLVVLMCAATFSITLRPTSVKAASLYGRPTPTPNPTHGVTPTATTGTGTSCQVTYTIEVQFHSGFTASMAITNTGSTTINGWTVQFAFPNGQAIQVGFNANFTQVGTNVTVKNASWNGIIAPGGAVLGPPPGFNGIWNNVANNPPASFTLNGTACSIIIGPAPWS